MRLPFVALVGRPNVGKSTLFNRIIGSRLAIVEDFPGTTRDRLYATSDWGGQAFQVVDTGGLEMGDVGELTARIRNQAQVAIEEAEVIVLVTDANEGVTQADRDVAAMLRQSTKPVVLAVNKAEKQVAQLNASEFWELGLGEPMIISALHGTGSGDLLDRVIDLLPPAAESEIEDTRLKVAILGRPNVGKSSLLNRLTGQERMIVSAVAGTTRDAVDATVRLEGEEIVLVDTAGIRRRGKIEPGIERYSVMRAQRALDRSDVAILLVDGVDGVTAQDTHIAGMIDDGGRGAIIAVNKWDLVEKDTHTADEYAVWVREELKFLNYAPVIFISALTGQRAVKVLQLAQQIHATRQERVTTGELNRLVADIQARHEFSKKGKALKIRYATQVGVAPPSFVFFVNDKDIVHFSTQRFIENQLRERYPFEGTPLRFYFRDKEPDLVGGRAKGR